MTVSKKEEYDNQFTLTRSEMAKELGITTNALKCRMRKGNTDGIEFRHDGNKFLFKGLRGNHGAQTLPIRPKGRWHDGNKKKKDYSQNLSTMVDLINTITIGTPTVTIENLRLTQGLTH